MENFNEKKRYCGIKKKADVIVSVEAGGKRFTLNCHRGLHRRYRLKVGKSWSSKYADITLTEIFDKARKWAAHRERPYWRGVK